MGIWRPRWIYWEAPAKIFDFVAFILFDLLANITADAFGKLNFVSGSHKHFAL